MGIFSFFGAFLRFLYRMLKGAAVIVFGLFAFVILIGLVSSVLRTKDSFSVADGAALYIPVEGFLVEETEPLSTAELLGIGGQVQVQTRLHDVTVAIRRATEDAQIGGIVLKLDRLFGASLAGIEEIGAALNAFKATGRPVVAFGDFYIQPQYLLATYADEIWLNPAGFVALEGFATYPLYFSEALDKVGVTINSFQAGTYKQFVEPYTRSSMSDAARQANTAFLGDLWTRYVELVETNTAPAASEKIAADAEQATPANDTAEDLQQSPVADIASYVETPLEGLRNAQGNSAKWASEAGLVTQVIDRIDVVARLREMFGSDGDGFAGTDYREYLAGTFKMFNRSDVVAVVYASGQILDGEQPPGTVGGDTLARRIRQARQSDKVKAIVLRVDSPGGSAFASEIIRKELLAAKADGKPVVASFGGVAASGGYWIASAADHIFAHPSSITGSIGVFALFPSFEGTLEKLGVKSDGVGTTPLAGAVSATRGVSPLGRELIETQVAQNYRTFLSIVSEARSLPLDVVDNSAQGRVWTGRQAMERSLIDTYGGLEEAIQFAAKEADLDEFDRIVVTDGPSPVEQLLEQLAPYMQLRAGQASSAGAYGPHNTLAAIEDAARQAQAFMATSASGQPYAWCAACSTISPGWTLYGGVGQSVGGAISQSLTPVGQTALRQLLDN